MIVLTIITPHGLLDPDASYMGTILISLTSKFPAISNFLLI